MFAVYRRCRGARLAALIVPARRVAEANIVRVAKQFGVAYMQFMVMEDQKLIEKHAKAAGLGVTTEWATVPLHRRDERRADLRQRRFRLARHSGHHHDLVEDQGHPDRGQGRARPQRVAADADGARSRHQVDQGLQGQPPHRDAGREGLDAGDHAADGGREGIRRRQVQRARSSDRVDGASGRDRRHARRAERGHGEFLLGAVPVPADEEPEHPPHPHQHGPVRRAAVVQRDRGDLEIPQPTIRSSTARSSRR